MQSACLFYQIIRGGSGIFMHHVINIYSLYVYLQIKMHFEFPSTCRSAYGDENVCA